MGAEQSAWEVINGKPSRSGLQVMVGSWLSSSNWSHYAYPIDYGYSASNAKFPQGGANFSVTYSNEGWLSLGRQVNTYTNGNDKAMIRQGGDFEIRDDHKFILNTTSAEWRGTEGDPYFIQLQISSWHPQGAWSGPASDHTFKLCLHEYFPLVRRLACTIHHRDTGAYLGTQVLDDSRGLGTIEYMPLAD